MKRGVKQKMELKMRRFLTDVSALAPLLIERRFIK